MSADFDSLTNRGEYLSAHYFAQQLSIDLKKGIFAAWAQREGDEHDPRKTPRELLRALRGTYLGEDVRGYFATAAESDVEATVGLFTYDDQEWRKRLADWHQDVLRALGYDAAPTELTVHRAGHDYHVTVAFHGHGIVALDCGWVADTDAALNPDNAGRLLSPLRISAAEHYDTGAALTSWLFHSELGGAGGPHPRFVLLLHGGVIILADRNSWSEGRYLAANLDAALERYDRTQHGELATIAALFSLDLLRPGDNDRAPVIDALLKASSTNAVGVSSELRHGLQRSVEILANEVLHRLAQAGNGTLKPADIEDPKTPFARELTRECLRYLYRILFLLYAEARPELAILPADDGSYEAGYSMARLRELVARDEELVEEEAKNGFHLYLSLDLLFKKVNFGHRSYGTEPDDDQPDDDEQTRQEKAARRSEDLGLRFEALRSDLFEPSAIRLIGDRVMDPRTDEDNEPRWLDLRPRNASLHAVLRLLTMKKGKRGERGGFISYRNLGINQLGAVYEGLMSYTGIIAPEELCEVAKDGNPEQGSWLIPSHRQTQYPDQTLIHYDEDEARKGLRGVKKYPKGSFVYRLSGRERETSASYYTPESLTKVTVELALKERLNQTRDANGEVVRTRAAELLSYKICEPALGSGAFLNEAINQVAEEYLRRRQDELGRSIPTADVLAEKQKAKAYIALHNAYGVDLNPAGVELAEVSLWLNTMHPGMRAPWFGLHLRRGNSLIGARRVVYSGHDVCSPAKAWLRSKGALGPTPLPLRSHGQPQPLPDDAVHQFLLPTPGWAAVAGSTEARKLAPTQTDRLATWRKGILQRPSRSTAHLNKDGSAKVDRRTQRPRTEATSQFTRLRDLARRAELLWSVVVKRMELSEQAIARRIAVWGADPADPEFAYMQQPNQATPKEKVLADLFEAVDTPYWRLKIVMDAWCALWFWPADRAGLLDGSDGEYTAPAVSLGADRLSELLGEAASTDTSVELVSATEPTPTPALPQASAVLAFSRPVPLFAIDGDQLSFDDLEHGEGPIEPPAQKSRSNSRRQPTKSQVPARRPVVPLKGLDDWLEFLEAMLGSTDLPEGTFLDSFDSLPRLKEFEEELPKYMGMLRGDPEARFPWLRVVRNIADKHGFLHWELEFALIFARDGGFDLQVGNPPWVRPEWQEDAVLAEHEPWFSLTEKPSAVDKNNRRTLEFSKPLVRSYLITELTTTEATGEFLSAPQTYPLIAGSRPDLYRAFMCQTWSHMSERGSVGLVHPDTHFNGEKEGRLRRDAYRRLRVHGDFVNAGNRFFPHPVGRHTHFGVHIYSDPGEIGFDHLSWLFSVDALRLSAQDDGTAPEPGVRFDGSWDERPHRKRIVRITLDVLARWRQLLGETDRPIDEARLLSPVSTAESQAIEALAAYPDRLSGFDLQVSSGFNETVARQPRFGTNGDLPLFDFHEGQRDASSYGMSSWYEVILKGPQLGVANPMFKQPGQNVDHREVLGLNLVELPIEAIPESEYARTVDFGEYSAAQDRWISHIELARLRVDEGAIDDARRCVAAAMGISESKVAPEKVDAVLIEKARRPYTDFYRLAWRRQIAPNTERALYAALIPPGPTHIDAVHTLAMPENRLTALVAGFWASLPLDYFLRATGRGDLRVSGARATPAPSADHPLASALLLRTLRLNCLTTAYADLWAELYDPAWLITESWAYNWKRLAPLHGVGPEWQAGTPLRTERARRAALVEIDALVAVWLGVSAAALKAMYRARFPVLQDFESVTWFDANERKIAGNRYTFGHGQTKETWEAFQAHRLDPTRVPPPAGYVPPFVQAEREKEMEQAHAAFQARLDDAVARGEWDLVTRKGTPS